MSGEAYPWFHTMAPEDLISSPRNMKALEAMALSVAGRPDMADAAREFEELILLCRQAVVRIGTRMDRLSGIMRAVNWSESSDAGEDYVRDELAKYRAELEPRKR